MTSRLLTVVFRFMQCKALCNKVLSVRGIGEFLWTSTWVWYWPDTRCQYKYWYIPNWNHITFFNCKSCPYSKLCQYCICLITMEGCRDPDCKLDIDRNDVAWFATVVHYSFLLQWQIFFRHFSKVTTAELLAHLSAHVYKKILLL